MWQYVQQNIDSKLYADMDLLYKKLNRKLDALTQHVRIENKLKEHIQIGNNSHKHVQDNIHERTDQHIETRTAICNRTEPKTIY